MDLTEFHASYYSVKPNSNTFIHGLQTNLQRLLNNAWNPGTSSIWNAVMCLHLKDIFLLELKTGQPWAQPGEPNFLTHSSLIILMAPQ